MMSDPKSLVAEMLRVLKLGGYPAFLAFVQATPALGGDARAGWESRREALQRVVRAHDMQNTEMIDTILAEHSEHRAAEIFEARRVAAAVDAARQMLTDESPVIHGVLFYAMAQTVQHEAACNIKRPRSYATSEGKRQFDAMVDDAYYELVFLNAVIAYYDYHLGRCLRRPWV
jgi:hypothetical protein